MIKRSDAYPKNIVENPRGGVGAIVIQPLLEGAELQSGSKAFGKITLPVGARIGLHQHVGDIEAYYILCGQAVVTDDSESATLNPGDLLFTGDGHWHSIENCGAVTVEFIGLILNK